MLILFVLCLLTLPDWSSPPFDLSITALSASSTALMDCNDSSSPSYSPSRVMNRTFLMRPPRVVISALNAFSRRPFRVLMRSGKRSDRSSQHSVALINNLLLPTSPETLSTVSSSVSVGTGVVSAITDKKAYFCSVGKKAAKLSKMIIDSLSSPPFGFAVALGGGEGLSVHNFLSRQLLQLGLEPKRPIRTGVHHLT
nr:hypothetical protein Iba_chr07eCG10920 [Ipomoea batatas]